MAVDDGYFIFFLMFIYSSIFFFAIIDSDDISLEEYIDDIDKHILGISIENNVNTINNNYSNKVIVHSDY
jgi:hypothetical protein